MNCIRTILICIFSLILSAPMPEECEEVQEYAAVAESVGVAQGAVTLGEMRRHDPARHVGVEHMPRVESVSVACSFVRQCGRDLTLLLCVLRE